MSALVPTVLSVAMVIWLLWPAELAGDWWRRLTFTGRHSQRWVRRQVRIRQRQAREIRRREQAALDRVWATGLAEMAARADYRRAVAWT